MTPGDGDFAELIQRVRAGDEAACQKLVDEYGPELRRVVRIRFREPLLHSMVDTADICQSVMFDFFMRVRLGQYEFESAQDLVRLLMTMARHKLLNLARRARVEKRQPQAALAETVDRLNQLPAAGESPSQLLMGEELLAKARGLLSDDERLIADSRRNGLDWSEIAKRIGDTPEATRKRLARAISRILEQMGIRQVDQ